MNRIRPSIQFLSEPARAMAFIGCACAFLELNPAAWAAESPAVIMQSNAVATGTNAVAAADVVTNTSPPATNASYGPTFTNASNAAPITNALNAAPVTNALNAAPVTNALNAAPVTNALNAAPVTNALNAAPVTNALDSVPVTNRADAATNLLQAAGTNSPAVLDDKHKLTIGDRLSFRIVEDEEDPKPLYVTDSGDIEVPYIGRVPAENKTCRELASEVKTALEKDYYYTATVILAVDLMTKSHGRVYLAGAVRLPGPVELPGDEVLTVSRAVLRAGGFTDYAKRDKVQVVRTDATAKDGKKTFTVDVGEIIDKQKIEKDLSLESGDLIFVPDKLIRF